MRLVWHRRSGSADTNIKIHSIEVDPDNYTGSKSCIDAPNQRLTSGLTGGSAWLTGDGDLTGDKVNNRDLTNSGVTEVQQGGINLIPNGSVGFGTGNFGNQ